MKNSIMILPLIIASILGVLLIIGLFTDFSYVFAVITLVISVFSFIKFRNRKEQNWPYRIGITACFAIILTSAVFLVLYILTITVIPDLLADII